METSGHVIVVNILHFFQYISYLVVGHTQAGKHRPGNAVLFLVSFTHIESANAQVVI